MKRLRRAWLWLGMFARWTLCHAVGHTEMHWVIPSRLLGFCRRCVRDYELYLERTDTPDADGGPK